MSHSKKANTISNMIIWVGILFSVGLIMLYGLPKIQPNQVSLDRLYQDMNSLQLIMNKACVSNSLTIEFNPFIENGHVLINSTSICLNSTNFGLCRSYQCEFEDLHEEYVLKDISLLLINKNEDIISIEVI
jgi:hypothetical protein